MIVPFVSGWAFLAGRKSRQSRTFRLGLGDGDGVEFGSFGTGEGDQMAAVVYHGNAHMGLQCMRSVDSSAEHFHRALPGQFFGWNSIHNFLLTLGFFVLHHGGEKNSSPGPRY